MSKMLMIIQRHLWDMRGSVTKERICHFDWHLCVSCVVEVCIDNLENVFCNNFSFGTTFLVADTNIYKYDTRTESEGSANIWRLNRGVVFISSKIGSIYTHRMISKEYKL